MAYNSPFDMVLLNTQTASSSSTLSFTSVISANFVNYYVKFVEIVPSTNNVSFQMLFSTNNGSTYLSTVYEWGNVIVDTSGTLNTTGSSSDSSITIAPNLSSTAANSLNGVMNIFSLNSNTYKPKLWMSGTYTNTTTCAGIRCMGSNDGTTAVNAIRFQMSSGNIASGSIYLYGLPTS